MSHDSPRHASSKNQGFDDDNLSFDDRAWAHWEYSPEEWALFERVDWQSVQFRYWLPNLTMLVCSVALGFVFIQTSFSVVFLVLGPTITGVLFLVRAYSYGEARKRHQARQNQAQNQKVTLARQGIWEAGTYFPFLALEKVSLTSQPAVLHFRRRLRVFSGRGNSTNRYDTLHVPVPHGHEEEAARLMERFHARITELNTHQSYSPPEPV